jgi:hypothetical protein
MFPVLPLLGARCAGAGGGRRIGAGGAELPKDFFVIFPFLRGFSAKCTGLRYLLDRSSVCVRVLYSCLSTA